MKKSKRKERKASMAQGGAVSDAPPMDTGSTGPAVREEKEEKRKPSFTVAKRESEKRATGRASVFRYVQIAVQFLRESRMELRKVKWPTRKELLASTAVVIALVIIVSFYLGLIDFGLIKIIKNIVR